MRQFRQVKYLRIFIFSFFLLAITIFFGFTKVTSAATLSVSPTAGTFTLGSIFDVSILLDSQGEEINAVSAILKYPPDKLQLVSPSTGKSIISIWTSLPSFDNAKGEIKLQGVIPGGINVESGLVTKLTFRATGIGNSLLKFTDDSQVLLHDGIGTDSLEQVQNGIYKIILPPPAGPIVASESHPNEGQWYSNPAVILKWIVEEEVQAYSYVLNKEPIDIPDNTPEDYKNSLLYKNIGNGVHYFHIKAMRDDVWGGITHFVLNIDTEPPAEFPIEITPSARTTHRRPMIRYNTTDSLSGLDYYKMKIIPLSAGIAQAAVRREQQFFIEVEEQYVPSDLELGSYDIIVRAYDKAGNYQEVVQNLKIVSPIFKLVADKGLQISSLGILPWVWVWVIVGLLLVLASFIAWWFRKWHHQTEAKKTTKKLPDDVSKQLEELRTYRKRYGKILFLFLFIGSTFFYGLSAQAQDIKINPPLITTISENFSNKEIFYIGGKTDAAEMKVIIYLQDLNDGTTISETTISDKLGDWFYSHDTFLASGSYLLWVQSGIGDILSPPSPQVQMTVSPTAIQFGSSRLSYETVYLLILIVVFLILLGLIVYTIYHAYHGRKKHRLLMKEVREAEESVRRGFAVLRRDIEAELVVIKKVKLSKEISAEEKEKEEQLLKDLTDVEKYISKEVWDIEIAERSN